MIILIILIILCLRERDNKETKYADENDKSAKEIVSDEVILVNERTKWQEAPQKLRYAICSICMSGDAVFRTPCKHFFHPTQCMSDDSLEKGHCPKCG